MVAGAGTAVVGWRPIVVGRQDHQDAGQAGEKPAVGAGGMRVPQVAKPHRLASDRPERGGPEPLGPEYGPASKCWPASNQVSRGRIKAWHYVGTVEQLNCSKDMPK